MTGPAITSPVPRAAWEAVLATDPDAVVGQYPAWRDAVLAGGDLVDASVLYAFPSGREVVLPLVRARLPRPGAGLLASWPQVWGTGGPISTGGAVTLDEAHAVLADVARRTPLTASLTLRPGAASAWTSAARLESAGPPWDVQRGSAYLIDLAGGFAEVWSKRFRGTARTAVRKAEKSGLEVEVDRTGRLLPVFSELNERAIRRRAETTREPLWLARMRMSRVTSTPEQLATVADRFGKACSTWVARRDGEPVASIILLEAGDQAKYWRGAMDRDRANPVRANDLLHRLAIEDACQRGARRYDMGSAQPDSPLALFKTKLGAVEQPTHELRARRMVTRVGNAARLRAEDIVKHALGLGEM